MKHLITSKVEERLPFYQRLIQTPSLRGEEHEAQSLVAIEMDKSGLEVDIINDPSSQSATLKKSMGPAVVGKLKGSGGGRSLILNFHIDTAPPGPEELWIRDPFSGIIEDGVIHGRGAVDDKAGCVEVLLLLDCLNELSINLKGDLIIQSVVEDEYSGRGTEICLRQGYRADAALIIDGHYGTRVANGNPGHLEFILTLEDFSPLSSLGFGDQALIEDTMILLKKLTLWSRILNKLAEPQWKKICNPNLNIGIIKVEQCVPGSKSKCKIEGLVRFGAPFTANMIMELLSVQIKKLSDEHLLFKKYTIDLKFGDLRRDPVSVTIETSLYTYLSESLKSITGKPATSHICSGWCDLFHFWNNYSIPCYLYGPGKGENAHSPNEAFILSQFLPHTEALFDFTRRWCGISI